MLLSLLLSTAPAPAIQLPDASTVSPTPKDAAAQHSPTLPVSVQLAWGDVDGDQLQDAVALRPDGGVTLLRNTADGAFEDVTEKAGLAELSGIRFALFGDYDNDTQLDLLLGTTAGPARLLQNQAGFFVDVSATSGLDVAGPHLSAHWTDYDGDERLDLHLLSQGSSTLYHAVGDGVFEPVALPFAPGHGPAGFGVARSAGTDAASGATSGATSGAETRPTGSNNSSSTSVVVTGSTDITAIGPDVAMGTTSLSCALSLADSGGAGCIAASSTPTLGLLYPMSPELNVDAATGNVGIGTTTPAFPAQLESGGFGFVQTDASQGTEVGTFINSSGGWVGTRSNDSFFLFSNNENAAVTVAPGGNVGIGTINPAVTLDVTGTTRFTGDVGVGTIAPEFPVQVEAGGFGFVQTDASQGTEVGTFINSSGGWVGTRSNDSFFLFSNNENAAVTVAPGGNVGIGTINPAQRLDVNGNAIVDVLTIRGGADLVEGFDSSDGELEPGTVVVIDPENAGALTTSTEPYDFKVAGIVSGAGGVDAGLHLGQDGVLDGDTKVAMTGRVYVKCSAENGAIRPGDRLTTASLAGHAMKATDTARSVGTVIGKAMSVLDEGTGLVLVLVNLQ